ncbi:serine/threonine-protein kinase [Prosthecobacter sp.]|uniref:serine/threonine-protein kinase n=1 Tax=Prosthecobacter sp. TaxID=1965333 RepID=UPI002487F671|nr:serine/threonine-protein kinase [Prosthecobacter sp.]MDI1311437.1 protein kinase [Prosthecobacter sp.]
MDSTTPSPDPFHGLNPADLMASAAMPTDGGADTLPLSRLDLPSLAEIAAAFPDLEILDLIGHGGMSAVFRARQPKLDRVVALKVLPKSLAATPGFPERFTREGRVLARLSHPNIVTVHDFGESGGFCFLTMEYVDGVNLRQAMRAGRFTPEQALNIIPVMCEALQYAHSQGVLHRDIKPENILLDAKGRVKIADFGIAKILDENGDGGMMLTQSGAKLGTAPYMAPEQIEQPGSVDHRADIYSLGVVFYEMLTGELPLGRFAAPSEKSAVNGNMDEVVFRALAKDRAMRQQSAGEFKTQIEGIAFMPPQMRHSVAMRFSSFEYKSKRTLFGRPLLHVAHGIDPATGSKRTARGFFAFGDRAIGVVAFGAYARGLFACGGMAVGVVALGGLSVGLISLGGVAIALLLAFGGLSVGLLATGGIALGWDAVGAIAAGVNAYGGQVYALVSGMGARVHAPHVMKTPAEMTPMLLLLVRITDQSAFLAAWIWLPMLFPSVLVPWWARRQLEFEALGGAQRATAWHERPSRVLWLLPASLLLFLALVWMTRHWSHAGTAGMTAQMIIASGIEIVGLLLAALSLPLWLRLVPMNSFYGVRLPSTFVSDERWYEVNAVFGKHLFGWSLTVIAAGIAGFYQLPRHQDAYSWAALTLILVGVTASVASTLVWMHRHPVGRPAIKPHRLVRNIEVAIPVIVLMFFIRAFIGASYSIPHGNVPGVAQGSRWIASKLDTGFASEDLVAYAHESGQTWLARVVAVETKGLLLKRGSSVEEFFMPWDKIIGKMMFPYYSPGTTKGTGSAASAPPPPVVEGTANALDQQPVLRFTRLALNGQDFTNPVYTTEGIPVSELEYKPLLAHSVEHQVVNQNNECCWLQLWFEHPDFDPLSGLQVEITDLDGQELKNRDHEFGGTAWSSNRPTPSLLAVVISPGRRGGLPSAVRVVLRYSIGRWAKGPTLPPDYHGGMSFGDQCLLAAIGDSPDHRVFVSWSKSAEDSTIYDAIAILKDGRRLGSSGRSGSSSGSTKVERVDFKALLREVASFQIRSRKVRTVTFDQVILPPLP